MRYGTLIFSYIFACSSILITLPALSATTDVDAKQIWQLLDYVAVDYEGAVQQGSIVSESEFKEMMDFSDSALSQAKQLPETSSSHELIQKIVNLQSLVEAKAEPQQVSALAREANEILLRSYPILATPKTAPNFSNGKAIYAQTCASCHGQQGGGNGPLAASLDPSPIAFNDHDRASARSLMALYLVISQGVQGTSMKSFSHLSENERWDLALFVGQMAYSNEMRKHGEQLWNSNHKAIKTQITSLAALASASELSLESYLQNKEDARDLNAYLRAHPEVIEAGKPKGIALAQLRLKESLKALQDGQKQKATELALSSYLDGFEPVESILAVKNKALLNDVESEMLRFRAAIKNADTSQAENISAKLDSLFVQANDTLTVSNTDPMTTFLGAFTILVREGVEALLIVVGMVAFLKKVGRADTLKYVHYGWSGALLAGLLTWAIATYIVGISGASREVTEGLGSIFAALVLLFVGLWMHQKGNADSWQEYLRNKLSAATSNRSSWTLFTIAFIAVYREVFETVLFYSTLAAEGNANALIAGFILALVVLWIIALIMLKTSVRMPIGKFFRYTTILVAFLSVIMIGKGVGALQEAGWISITTIDITKIEMLGIFPTIESIVSQVMVAIILLLGLRLARRRT